MKSIDRIEQVMNTNVSFQPDMFETTRNYISLLGVVGMICDWIKFRDCSGLLPSTSFHCYHQQIFMLHSFSVLITLLLEILF